MPPSCNTTVCDVTGLVRSAVKKYKHFFTLNAQMCPWSTKAVISNTGIFVAIANNTLYGSKLLFFLLCQKSLG